MPHVRNLEEHACCTNKISLPMKAFEHILHPFNTIYDMYWYLIKFNLCYSKLKVEDFMFFTLDSLLYVLSISLVFISCTIYKLCTFHQAKIYEIFI